MKVQSLPTELSPRADHNQDHREAGSKPAQQTMDLHVACLHQQNERGNEEQPERGDHGMHVRDPGNRRRLVKVVVKVKAEADANDDPKGRKPDEGIPAIVARRPGCPCMHLHSL